MQTNNYNINGSTVSEVYDLLDDSDNSLVKINNNSFMLNKPAQNSELREIKFRKFTPIMKKSLSTLTQRQAQLKISPRFLKSRRIEKDRKVNIDIKNIPPLDMSLIPSWMAIDHPLQPCIGFQRVNHSVFKNSVFHIKATVFDKHGFKYNKSIIAYFNENQVDMIRRSIGDIDYKMIRYEQWASSYMFFDNESYGTFVIRMIHYSQPIQGNLLNVQLYFYNNDESVPSYDDSRSEPYYDDPGFIIIDEFDTWIVDSKDNTKYRKSCHQWTEKVINYNNEMLFVDESKIMPYTYANNTNLPIKSATLQTNLIGSVSEIISNINEKLAGYFSNFKPSSTIHLKDLDTKESYLLSYYLNDPLNESPDMTPDDVKKGLQLQTYYKYYNFIPVTSVNNSAVTPQCYFTRIYSQMSKIDNLSKDSITYETELMNTIYGVHNMLFQCRNFNDSSLYYDCLWMYFDVELHCDVEIFNISVDRMWHNTYEGLSKHTWAAKGTCFESYNQCISTNADTIKNLIYANYLANGLDLVLKTPLMNNISNIVFVNETESQVIMKHTQQFSTANCINVYITDLTGKNVNKEYLKQIYKSVLLEIDFVYN